VQAKCFGDDGQDLANLAFTTAERIYSPPPFGQAPPQDRELPDETME